MKQKLLVLLFLLLTIACKENKTNKTSKPRIQTNSIGSFTNGQGFTMVMINEPKNFVMGSPVIEKYHSKDEIQHLVSIPRSFAISDKEVTQQQFQMFLSENPEYKKAWTDAVSEHFKFRGIAQFISDPQNPQAAVSWYDAVSFCNWLSKKEGIPKNEWCYPDNIGSGMTLPADYLKRKGYRLPTEAEWEYAARASTATSHFFGESDSLLNEYAWYEANSNSEKTKRVGSLKPNQYGLFDVYGNVWEWCQDKRKNYPENESLTIDKEDSGLKISDTIARTRRGGSFTYGPETTRSAHRGTTTYFPNQRRDGVGFRIAKTIQ